MGEITDPGTLAQLNATGDDFLKQVSATHGDGYAALIKATASGESAPPNAMMLRTPFGQQFAQDVYQYDHTADAANLPARSATRKAFTSGKQGQNITSFNTAIGHLGTLAQSAEALGNTSIPAWNSIGNFVDTQTGDPRVTNFNVAKQAVVDELERAFKGTGGNVHEIEQWENTLNSSRSPAQLRGAIQQAGSLLQSRIGAMRDSYNAGMGTTDQPLPMLNQHASDALGHLLGKDYLDKGYGAADSTPAVAAAIGGGGTPPGGAPPSAGGGNTPPGTPPVGPQGGAPGGGNPSVWQQGSATQYQAPGSAHTFATDQDKSFAAATQRLLDNPKSTRADFDALAAQYGQGKFGSDIDEALKVRAANPGAQITVNNNQSGREGGSVVDQALATVGAAGTGFADSASLGTINKVAAGVGAVGDRLAGDNRDIGDIYDTKLAGVNLQRDLMEGAHPAAALAGNVGGFLVGDAALGKGLKALGGAIPGVAALGSKLPTVLRPAAQDAAFGAAYGVGSSDAAADVPGNALTGAALGAGGSVLGRGAARAAAGVLNPAVSAGVRRLSDAGVALTPGQILRAGGGKLGGMVGGIEDRIAGFSGVGDIINGARRGGIEDFNRASLNDALAPIGEKASDVGHTGIADAQQKVSNAFTDSLSRMNAAPDAQLTTDLRAAAQKARKLGPEGQATFASIMDNDIQPILAGKQHLSGKDLQAVKQSLDGEIGNLRGQGSSPQDRNLADRLADVRDSFMDLAGRTTPDAAADFQKANKAYSMLARIEDAASRTNDGVFSPNQFKQAVGRKGYGTTRSNLATNSAPMQQLANDASQILPSKVPDSGTAGRGQIGRLALGAIVGSGTGYEQNGLAGAALGAGAGAAMFSRPGLRAAQGILIGNRGKALTTLGDVIRANASLGGAVGTPLLLKKLSD